MCLVQLKNKRRETFFAKCDSTLWSQKNCPQSDGIGPQWSTNLEENNTGIAGIE